MCSSESSGVRYMMIPKRGHTCPTPAPSLVHLFLLDIFVLAFLML